jgi:hypothetical protein
MTERRIYGAWIVGTALIVLGALAAGCAGGWTTVKKDARDVAEVCAPEAIPDALQMVPLVAALADCEYRQEDCTAQLAAVKAAGSADAKACAVAIMHAEAVKLAGVDGGADAH